MASALSTAEHRSAASAVDLGVPVFVAPTSRELPVLSPQPIPPDWIIEGDPQARAIELTGGGPRDCTSGIWACTAGVFDWTFSADEIVRILNGEVQLRFADREQVARAGDVVAFRRGTTVRWTIPEYLEKFWVLGPAPTFGERLVRKIRRVLNRS